MRCPSCDHLLYSVATNPEVYAIYLVKRCIWCGYDLRLPRREFTKYVSKVYKKVHRVKKKEKTPVTQPPPPMGRCL